MGRKKVDGSLKILLLEHGRKEPPELRSPKNI